MGDFTKVLANLLTVFFTFVYYVAGIAAIAGEIWSYIQSISLFRNIAIVIEQGASPQVTILLKILYFCRFLVIPVIGFGMYWAVMYDIQVVK